MSDLSIDDLKEKLKEMSLDDCAEVVKESMTALYDKLRTEEGFGWSMSVTGELEGDFPRIYIINNSNAEGSGTNYGQIYKL